MIPIGTRCIVAKSLEGKWVGRVVTVIGHYAPPVKSREGNLVDHKVDASWLPVRRNGWATLGKWLIPIGHDPDAETRKTGREVEA